MGPSNILHKTHSLAYALSIIKNSLLRILILYQLLLGQVVTNIYPIVPCPSLAPLYLTLTHFEQEATLIKLTPSHTYTLSIAFGPSCDEYLSHCPLPLAPCPSLSHLNTFRAGSHGTLRAEILCREGLAPSVDIIQRIVDATADRP